MGENAKYDQGKNRLDLVFPSIIEEIGFIRTYGVQKYKDPDNWKRIDNAKQRYTAAAMRHFEAWRKGEKLDSESGLRHLAHCATNIMFLLEIEREEEATEATVVDVMPDPDAPASNPEEEKFVELLKDYDLVAKLSAAIEKKKAEATETAKEENKEKNNV